MNEQRLSGSELPPGVQLDQPEALLNGAPLSAIPSPPDSLAGLPSETPVEPATNGTDLGIETELGDTANEMPADPIEAQDLQNRYTDAELLGRSFPVQRAIHELGTRSIKVWQGLKAKVHNAIDTPGKVIRQFAYNRAKSSYDRVEKRLNEAHDLRLRQRRQVAFDRAKDRLDSRSASLDERVSRMRDRTSVVHENAENRRQQFTEKLIGQRQYALARKEVRHQLRSDGANRREVKAILAEIPNDMFDRIGKVASVAETSRRKYAEVQKFEQKATARQTSIAEQIATTKTRAQTYVSTINQAEAEIKQIRDKTMLVSEQNTQNIQAKLADLKDNDPEYDILINQLQREEQNLATYRSQLTYLDNVVANNRLNYSRAAARLAGLHQLHSEHQSKLSDTKEQVGTQ